MKAIINDIIIDVYFPYIVSIIIMVIITTIFMIILARRINRK